MNFGGDGFFKDNGVEDNFRSIFGDVYSNNRNMFNNNFDRFSNRFRQQSSFGDSTRESNDTNQPFQGRSSTSRNAYKDFFSSNDQTSDVKAPQKVHHIHVQIEPRDTESNANTTQINDSKEKNVKCNSGQVSACSSQSNIHASNHSINSSVEKSDSEKRKTEESENRDTFKVGQETEHEEKLTNEKKEYCIKVKLDDDHPSLDTSYADKEKSNKKLLLDNKDNNAKSSKPGQKNSTANVSSKEFSSIPRKQNINVRNNPTQFQQNSSAHSNSNDNKQSNIIDNPTQKIEKIDKIIKEAAEYEKEIEEFEGEYQDKRYRFLDEYLTRCMLKLDNIDTDGDDKVKNARKIALNYINNIVSKLEAIFKTTKCKTENENKNENESKKDDDNNLAETQANKTN